MKTDENEKVPRATPKRKAAPRRRAPLAESSAEIVTPRVRRPRGERAAVYFVIASLLLVAAAGAAISGQEAASREAGVTAPSYTVSSGVAGASAPEGKECPGLREAATEMRAAITQLDRWIAWGEATSKGADAAYTREATYTPAKCPDGSQYPTYSGEDLAEFSDEIAGRSGELAPQLSLMKAELTGLDARLSAANCH